MLHFIFVLLLMDAFSTVIGANRQNSLKALRKKPFAALVFSNTNNLQPSDKKPCQWLSRLKHQSKLCWKRRGLSEVLLKAKNLSITQCESQFMYDQWNCSKREFLFRKIYRETAFMYSIASSAVMFSIARACSEGTLAGCTCGEYGKKLNDTKWQWSGCPDNLKFAKKFTTKFLQLRKKGDGLNAVVKYNTEVGIKVVLQSQQTFCRCHGVSGTCTIKICINRMPSFQNISQQLKSLYHNALKVQPSNKIRISKGDRSALKLLYLENSPNFCESTTNRLCSSKENCATVCCGRDAYPVKVEVVNNRCLCKWNNKKQFVVECAVCVGKKEVFVCR